MPAAPGRPRVWAGPPGDHLAQPPAEAGGGPDGLEARQARLARQVQGKSQALTPAGLQEPVTISTLKSWGQGACGVSERIQVGEPALPFALTLRSCDILGSSTGPAPPHLPGRRGHAGEQRAPQRRRPGLASLLPGRTPHSRPKTPPRLPRSHTRPRALGGD